MPTAVPAPVLGGFEWSVKDLACTDLVPVALSFGNLGAGTARAVVVDLEAVDALGEVTGRASRALGDVAPGERARLDATLFAPDGCDDADEYTLRATVTPANGAPLTTTLGSFYT